MNLEIQFLRGFLWWIGMGSKKVNKQISKFYVILIETKMDFVF